MGGKFEVSAGKNCWNLSTGYLWWSTC